MFLPKTYKNTVRLLDYLKNNLQKERDFIEHILA